MTVLLMYKKPLFYTKVWLCTSTNPDTSPHGVSNSTSLSICTTCAVALYTEILDLTVTNKGGNQVLQKWN